MGGEGGIRGSGGRHSPGGEPQDALEVQNCSLEEGTRLGFQIWRLSFTAVFTEDGGLNALFKRTHLRKR